MIENRIRAVAVPEPVLRRPLIDKTRTFGKHEIQKCRFSCVFEGLESHSVQKCRFARVFEGFEPNDTSESQNVKNTS